MPPTHVSADQVVEFFYGFAQKNRLVRGDRALPLDLEAGFFALLEGNSLTAEEIAQWSEGYRLLLAELMAQYIMALMVDNHLTYPPTFLDGCTDHAVGPSVLRYWREQRWPVPRLLGR